MSTRLSIQGRRDQCIRFQPGDIIKPAQVFTNGIDTAEISTPPAREPHPWPTQEFPVLRLGQGDFVRDMTPGKRVTAGEFWIVVMAGCGIVGAVILACVMLR